MLILSIVHSSKQQSYEIYTTFGPICCPVETSSSCYSFDSAHRLQSYIMQFGTWMAAIARPEQGWHMLACRAGIDQTARPGMPGLS